MDNAREAIIKELGELVQQRPSGYSHKLSYTMKRWEFELVTDYFMARERKMIDRLYSLESKLLSIGLMLKAYRDNRKVGWGDFDCDATIDKAIKAANLGI